MKKILAIALGTLTLVGTASATTVERLDETLVDGYQDIAPLTRQINLAQTGTLTAIAARDGFIKQDFDFTVSANVVLGLVDDAAGNRMGVIAGSNKGYNVFTGSSVGGSVSSCGKQVPKDTPDLGASEVVTANLDLDEANGCAREL